MRTVVGMFEMRPAAEDAIQRLLANGFTRDQIGVAMRDPREAGEITESHQVDDMSAEGATTGAVSGAGVGALVGLAMAGSSIVLPGLGPILIGGPIAAGLTGAGLGAASGGLIGGLIGAGIPEDEARDHSELIERGHILVSVRCDEAAVPAAREILIAESARRA